MTGPDLYNEGNEIHLTEAGAPPVPSMERPATLDQTESAAEQAALLETFADEPLLYDGRNRKLGQAAVAPHTLNGYSNALRLQSALGSSAVESDTRGPSASTAPFRGVKL